MEKLTKQVVVLLALVLLLSTGCSGGGAGSSPVDQAFSEALTLYLSGGVSVAFETLFTDQDSNYNGSITNEELTSDNADATGSIDYVHVYDSGASTYTDTLTFNSYSCDTTLYSSVLSGSTVTLSSSTVDDNSSTTTGTLTYAGENLVFNTTTDTDGNAGGTITFKGVAYPFTD